MAFSFEGKRVLVTGGCGGLGSTIVRGFYNSGATVYALDIDEKGLVELAKELPGLQVVVADVSKWNELKKKVEELGPLDHLVNNVGIFINLSSINVTEAECDKIYVNFKSAVNVSQVFANAASIAHGIKKRYNRKHFASMFCAKEGGPVYSCMKAALDMLTKSHATTLGQHGIRVNAVNPSMMKTAMTNDLPPQMLEYANKLITIIMCNHQSILISQ